MRGRGETHPLASPAWRWGLASAAAALVAAALLWRRPSGGPAASGSPADPIRTVQVVEIKPEDLRDTYPARGVIRAEVEIDLRFQAEGVIEAFDLGNGDRVRKGDLIAYLNQDEARVDLDEAKLDFEQKLVLFQANAITLSELERARLKVERAKIALRKTTLAAPRSGVLSGKRVSAGQFVTPRDPVARLATLDAVVVETSVPETDIDRIAIGQAVTLRVDALPGAEFRARIGWIDPDAEHHSFKVGAPLQNPGLVLLPGMLARLDILVHEEPHAVGVPPECLDRGPGGSRVFVVDAESRARARPVVVGYSSSRFAVVSDGLLPGDRVITHRPSDLRDGQRVRVQG